MVDLWPDFSHEKKEEESRAVEILRDQAKNARSKNFRESQSSIF